jgi:hypothetical protein
MGRHRAQSVTEFGVAVLDIFGWPMAGRAALPLETETARLMKRGRTETRKHVRVPSFGGRRGHLRSDGLRMGRSRYRGALYRAGLVHRHPPRVGPKATGIGDTEATLAFRFFEERPWVPAFAVAGEGKVPTARDALNGTGKADYTAILPGALDVVRELLANTTSAPESPEGGVIDGESRITPEAAGGERSGMLGARYFFFPNAFASSGVSYDNNQAVLFRPGVTAWAN